MFQMQSLLQGERNSLVLPVSATSNKSPDYQCVRLSEVAVEGGDITMTLKSTPIFFPSPITVSILTLLKSLAVELSSSLQGMRWTNASIWYLARMNSDLFGLSGRHETWNNKTERDTMNAQAARLTIREFSDSFTKITSSKQKSTPESFPNIYDSLEFVLRVGLAFSTHNRGRVQEGVLPNWICTIVV